MHYIFNVLAAIAAYGILFAFFQRKYTHGKELYGMDMGLSLVISILIFACPISLLVVFVMTGVGRYGFKFK